ncbi:MAG: hypothetical protein ACFB0B_04415 [Thermonemataceae bacterium]
MKEVLEVAFSPTHFFFSTLLLMCLFYWLTVFVGIFYIDSFDLGKDLDVDVDQDIGIEADKGIDFEVEVEADTDVSVDKNVEMAKGVEAAPKVGWLTSILLFLNFGKIPFMIILSITALIAWNITMLKTYYLGFFSFPTELGLYIPILAVSLVMTKYITNPLRSVFKDFESEFSDNKDIVGQICEITISSNSASIGQAKVKTLSSPVLISIKATEGNILDKGAKGLVVDYDAGQKIYTVEPFSLVELES